MSEYKEILLLYEYCKEIGINATLSELFNGYCIRFNNGGDVVQHFGSYGSGAGCVEPAIGCGCELDYTAVPLDEAKSLLKRYKEELNKRCDNVN